MVVSKEQLASKAQELSEKVRASQPDTDQPGGSKDQLVSKAQEFADKFRAGRADAHVDGGADLGEGGAGANASGVSKDQLVSKAQEFADKFRAGRADADVDGGADLGGGEGGAGADASGVSKVQEITDKVRDSRFGKDVLGPKLAQPLASWLDTNFGDAADAKAGLSSAELPHRHSEPSATVNGAAPTNAVAGLSGTTPSGVASNGQASIARPTASVELEAGLATEAGTTPEISGIAPTTDPAIGTAATTDTGDPDLDLSLSSPKDILGFLKALGARVKEHNLVVVAAGIAFWGLLAIPAILIATVSIAGLVLDPATVKDSVKENLNGLPPEAQEIIGGQLESVSGGSSGGLIFGVVLGIALALWTASGAMAKLMATLNTIYNTTETRKFPKLRGTALGLTFGGIVFISSAVFLLAAMPALLGSLDGVGDSLVTLFNVLRFPLLGIVMVLGLGVLYHVGPDRSTKYRPLTMGAMVAMVLWIGLSGLFTVYTATVGSYNETYGTMGGLVILLMWLFITAFVVLLGAEIHSESESTS